MNDDQFKELAKRFDKIDERFDSVDKRLVEHDNQFKQLHDLIAKLYEHMEQRFDKLQAELTKKADRAQVDRLTSLVDQDLKRRETDEQERSVVNHQLDRHEDWINRASQQLGVNYEP